MKLRTSALITAAVSAIGVLSFYTVCRAEDPVQNTARKDAPKCLVSFEDFRASLTKAIASSGGDAEQNTYHFVILINTVRTRGPRAQAVRDLYSGLLNSFLVGSDKASDLISFSPFELDLWGRSAWNRPFRRTRESIKQLYALAPKQPQERTDSLGGHDDEQALISALTKIKSPDSAVIIVLSDSEVSEPPAFPKDYVLTADRPDFAEQLQSFGHRLATRGRIDCETADAEGRPVRFAVFYSIYAPPSLQPLKEIAETNRTSLVREPPQSEIRTTEAKPKADESVERRRTAQIWVSLLAGIAAVIAAAVLIWFLSLLRKPRDAMIDGVLATVRYGRPLFVGGDPEDRKCVQIPSGRSGQRIAVLEVQFPGSVILRKYGPFEISCGSEKNIIRLTATDKTVYARDTRSDEYIEFKARLVSG